MIEVKLTSGSIQPGDTIFIVDNTRKLSASGTVCKCGAGHLSTYRVKIDAIHLSEDASASGVSNASVTGMCDDSGLEGKRITFVRVPKKQCFLTRKEADDYREGLIRKRAKLA